MKKISICITTYNRGDITHNSYENIVDDERISEVVIVDDKSKHNHYALLCGNNQHPKVKLYRNEVNLGVYRNKFQSVLNAENEWCIVFDSDNVIYTDYLDCIYNLFWDANSVYLPSFARPDFDYRHLVGKYTRFNISNATKLKKMDAMLNTMNFFINRQTFLDTHDNSFDPISADSIYKNYMLLNAGKCLVVVDGLEYDHLIHKGSHFKETFHKSVNMHRVVNSKIKMMR